MYICIIYNIYTYKYIRCINIYVCMHNKYKINSSDLRVQVSFARSL